MIRIRVVLPTHLRELARAGPEVHVEVTEAATIAEVVEAVEGDYPSLLGTIRDQTTNERRPYLRYIAGGEDLSHVAPASRVPEAVVTGEEPFLIIGAIAGGAR